MGNHITTIYSLLIMFAITWDPKAVHHLILRPLKMLQEYPAKLLPATGLRCLHGVVELRLEMGLTFVAPRLLNATPHLTFLGLNHNSLETIPPSVAELKELRTLEILCNPTLDFVHKMSDYVAVTA